ncbi:ATPase, partial [Aquibacillus sp. 3ASR75-54]|nr:ATPase [Aquibacillus salsiterrae]
ALLASYMMNKQDGEILDEYLNEKIFGDEAGETISPNPKDVDGFAQFMERYTKGLAIERAAVENLK